VRYVLDLAEIPTFQARQAGGIDPAEYARRLAAGAHLRVDGHRSRLVPIAHALAFPEGAGGLRTTRLEVILRGPRVAGTGRITYRDTNYAGRLGWREIVVGAHAKSRSDELRAYPKDLLESPLHVTSLTATVAPTSDPPPGLTRGRALEAPDRVADGGFASLIARDNLSAGFVLLSLAIAMFWGAAHAFSPGHGKSIVAAYLVGSRGTPRHAVFLGLTVTVTHTIGVFALGLVTLSLSEFIVPDQLYPWLNLVSALLIVAVGVSVLRWRVREWTGARSCNHAHEHGHAHTHSHGSVIARPGTEHDHALSARRLLGIGISGGIVPCPTALVVLLAAISLHRVGYGLVLILAFSLGLAAAMTAIGILAVSAKRVFRRVDFDGGLVRLLPAASALVVLGLGLVMTLRALPKVT
jgi:ABC-type nickel/cobalt efflux system permease component RcnA